MTEEPWAARTAKVVAGEVRRHRKHRGMSTQQLSDACGELGHPIARSVLANFESGRRPTVSVPELLVLARALDVPPLALVFPAGYEEEIEVLPGRAEHPITGMRWASGEGFLPEEGDEGRRTERHWAKAALVLLRQLLRNEAVLRRNRELALDQWARAREAASEEARQAYEHTARATERMVAGQEEMLARWRREAEDAGLMVGLPPLYGEVTNFLIDAENPRPSSFD